MYEISFDARDRILHLKLIGFWTLLTLAKFGAELLMRVTLYRLRHRDFAVLSDSRAFDVQTADVASGLDRIMARGADTRRGPTAIVVASQLNRIQAKRTLNADNLELFTDMAAAEAWLAEHWTARQAA